MDSRKRSLGRNVFEKAPAGERTGAIRNLIEGRGAAGEAAPREVEVRIKLTPSNLKHLDDIRRELERRGKGRFTRSELIRVAIALLSSGDF